MRTMLASVALAFIILSTGYSLVFAECPQSAIASPGLSKTPPAPHGAPVEKKVKRHGIFGTVTAKGSNSLTVHTQKGDVVVTVTSETKIHVPTKRNATLADIAVNDRVAVNGTPTASGLTAKQIVVVPGKPTIRHRVGQVTAFTPNASITLKDRQGGTETFVVNAQTIIRNPKGTGVSVGDTVTIVSRRDPGTDVFTASAIVVHPK